jgi:hypothetical protein
VAVAFINGDDIYIAGYENNVKNYVAKLWKNGIAINLGISTTNDTYANAIYAIGKEIYVTGYEQNETYNVHKIWKNNIDIDYKNEYKIDVRSIFISQKKL